MYPRAARCLPLVLFVACSGADDGTTPPGSASGVSTDTSPDDGSSSGTGSSTSTSPTTTSPWGDEYGGHYKPPWTGCLEDEAEDFAGLGMACLPKCIDGQCPPPPPGTSGVPACAVDLDESIPGPDHCVITCKEQADCQGEGYTCKDEWCSWP